MAAAYVRALVTVLLMGRVAVLYRYCAVLVTLFCTRGRRPASPAALCTRGRWPARSPSAPRAFGSARRLEARPGPAAALGHYSLPRTARSPQTRPRLVAALGHRSLPHAEGAPHHPPRPCRRPRALQPPACRRGATPPTQASPPPPDTAASRALHGRHKHTQALPSPSGTAASHALHGHHQTRPGLVATLGYRRPRKRITQQTPPSTRPGGVDL